MLFVLDETMEDLHVLHEEVVREKDKGRLIEVIVDNTLLEVLQSESYLNSVF
jgi:hypothetical protein